VSLAEEHARGNKKERSKDRRKKGGGGGGIHCLLIMGGENKRVEKRRLSHMGGERGKEALITARESQPEISPEKKEHKSPVELERERSG